MYVTCEMQISESLVGGLIGRSGSNISKIRNESGATIKVCVCECLIAGQGRFTSIDFNCGSCGLVVEST